MNILTKICVVLLLVASLIASVVFISMATTGPSWRAKYDGLKKDHSAEIKKGKESAKLLATSKGRVSKLEEALVKLENDLKNASADKEGQITELKKDKQQLQAAIDDFKLKLESLDKTGKLNTTMVANLRKELADAHKIQNEKAARVAQLNEELNEEKARNVRLTKSLRSANTNTEDLKRQIAELNTKLQSLEKVAGKGADDIVTDLAPATRVTGTISDVSDNLASINVGSAHGLKAGMKLIVYRGSKFVGWLKLEQVSADEAAGVMVDKQCEPMRGDKVTSSLE